MHLCTATGRKSLLIGTQTILPKFIMEAIKRISGRIAEDFAFEFGGCTCKLM